MKRRDFITKTISAGAAISAAPIVLDGFSVRAFAHAPWMAALAAAGATDRVLVMVVLDGGNDGLNMVVPYENGVYYNARPTIAIKKADVLKINSTVGFHPTMTGFDTLRKDGKLALLQNVGYASPNRSHFRSMDIWNTGSDYDQLIDTGWLGRYLDKRFPNYPSAAPAYPLAIQIGSTLSLALQGPSVGMGMAIFNVEQFYQLIQGTDTSGGSSIDPSTRAGKELAFIKQVQEEARTYAKPIRESFNSVTNKATYPGGSLSQQLAIVARLIAGSYQGSRLGTPLYIVRIGGFDTHANQVQAADSKTGAHMSLLNQVSQGIQAFLQDCKLNSVDDRVLVMTMSEFGRRVNENGTFGTDHGTCAPQFLVGNAVRGGVFGRDPDLTNLDSVGDMKFEIEYRQMYASVLEQWFGVAKSDLTSIFNGKSITTLPLINAVNEVGEVASPATITLEQNYPNPLRNGQTTRIEFSLREGDASLSVFDIRGREVATLVHGRLDAGNHQAQFTPNNLPSGGYFYRLTANGASLTKQFRIVK